MDPYEREVARLTALYDKVISEEEVHDSDSSIEVNENEIFSDHQTDTEQEDEGEVLQDESVDETDRRLYYYGNDSTKWKKHSPPKNIRTRSENIISHLPGTIREAKNVRTPIDSWDILFDNLLEVIVRNTNIYITSVAHRYKNQSDTKMTTVSKIKTFIGLLYLVGLDHGSKKNLKEFWEQDGMGSELFIATMSQRRFRFLLRVILSRNFEEADDKKNDDSEDEAEEKAKI
ncbi:hypothetical protein NQ314_007541 [Rhamnusium bicolor]|uniref:PiggyBac transposable element-derived protein domain-containing protein n=1 Tax=Rhamnusium bicolor TaxID=1586634 RepID=A0AAV8YNH7_9CUCU|nr:hypothetical protein NQ314_007541 [Rhamnusium bicolor]